jgi:Fe-S-cluster containining protein
VRLGFYVDGQDRALSRFGKRLDLERVACPLLEKNRCMIYEARPLTCRLHAVVDTPEKCADPNAIMKFVVAHPIMRQAMRSYLVAAGETDPRSKIRFLGDWICVLLGGK